MKKYIAEALGTFALTLVVGFSLRSVLPVPTPVLAGLTLALFVYSIGHISGSHINPAVTIGAWAIKKIKTDEAIKYIIAQLLGGWFALVVASSFAGKLPLFMASNSVTTLLAEAVGMFFFAFGIASVVYGKNHEAVSGVVVGGSLLLGIMIAVGMGSLGILNPAVSIGLGAFNLMYILGPIVGSVAGMRVYSTLMQKST